MVVLHAAGHDPVGGLRLGLAISDRALSVGAILRPAEASASTID